MHQRLRVGTRKSPLALAQVHEVLRALKRIAPAVQTEIVGIDTVGDRDKKTPISEMEGTDFFTREIDDALIQGKVDFAVHSAKDLPDVLPRGIRVAAVTASVDPYDVLVSRKGLKLSKLPRGATIGTSSERRKKQLRAYRPDFNIVDIRGTMQERLDQLETGGLDAIVIAAAGLTRLGLGDHITERISLNVLRPHPLQGSLAITVRLRDRRLQKLFSKLHRQKIAPYTGGILSGKKSGKRILVTGTDPDRFRSRGEMIHVPMIEIRPVRNFAAVDAAIKRLAMYDGIIFTSKHAVRYFLDRGKVKIKHLKTFKKKEIMAIGKTTAGALREYGLSATRVALEESSEGMVKMLRRFPCNGTRFLVPRSNLSNDKMIRALREIGVKADAVTVYRNVRPKINKLDLSRVDEIVFTSPSTVKNFLNTYRKIPKPIQVWAMGPVTRSYLEGRGIKAGLLKDDSH